MSPQNFLIHPECAEGKDSDPLHIINKIMARYYLVILDGWLELLSKGESLPVNDDTRLFFEAFSQATEDKLNGSDNAVSYRYNEEGNYIILIVNHESVAEFFFAGFELDEEYKGMDWNECDKLCNLEHDEDLEDSRKKMTEAAEKRQLDSQ